jgi:hypothetical protein
VANFGVTAIHALEHVEFEALLIGQLLEQVFDRLGLMSSPRPALPSRALVAGGPNGQPPP